jgi:hypothetical protein
MHKIVLLGSQPGFRGVIFGVPRENKKIKGKLRGKPRGKLRGKRRRKAVINRNVINAVYLSRYKRRNYFVKIFTKKLIKINKKI